MGLYCEDFGRGGAGRLGISKPEEKLGRDENERARSEEQQHVRERFSP